MGLNIVARAETHYHLFYQLQPINVDHSNPVTVLVRGAS